MLHIGKCIFLLLVVGGSQQTLKLALWHPLEPATGLPGLLILCIFIFDLCIFYMFGEMFMMFLETG